MNKIYCTIWNPARHAWIVVSETACNRSKSSGSELRGTSEISCVRSGTRSGKLGATQPARTLIAKVALAVLLGCGAATAWAGSYDVTVSTDNGTGNTANSLSWAIIQANANPGSIINFAPGLIINPSADLPALSQTTSFATASGAAQVNASLSYGGSGILTFGAGIGFVGGSGSNGTDDTSSTFAGYGGLGGGGGAGVNGSSFTLINGGNITGGGGGSGGWVSGNYGGSVGINGTGGNGGSGGAGVNGTGFILTNGGVITGGGGGSGGIVMVTGGGLSIGGVGGTGGAGVNGSGFTLNNSGSVAGGSGGSGGLADRGVGGAGGMGGTGVNGSGFTLTNSGSVNGGSGGGGGNAGNGAGYTGGSGGSGVSGSGFTLRNDGSIAGGKGGDGGAALTGIGGDGGDGGAGVSGSGFTLDNRGSITGGSGGSGGYGSSGGSGSGGSGNVGVWTTGGATITNSGTISGSNGTAISLEGGNNKLVITSTSVINGNVVSTSGTTNGGDTLALGGLNNASFDLNQTSTDASKKYQGFYNFMKEGGSAWTISGSSSFAGGTTVSAGTLQMADGTHLTTGNVDVQSAATLAAAGRLDVSGNVNNAGTITNAGTISLNGSATYGGTGSLVLQGNDVSGGVFSNASSNTATVASLSVAANKYGTLSGSGTVQVNDATVNTGATLVVMGNAVFSHSLTNNGTLTNELSGMLTNNGTLTNKSGGTLSNIGMLENTDTLTNQFGATLINRNTLNNGGTLNNSGTLNNESSGMLLNGGMLTNAGTLTNKSGGALTNELGGMLLNAGTLTNFGALTNKSGGMLTNTGTLINNGTLTNNGTLNNTGTLTGMGTLTNTGTLNMDSGGKLVSSALGSGMTINGNLNFNSGSIYQVAVNTAGQSGITTVNGTTTIASGVTLSVLAQSGTYAPSTSYTVLHTATLSGTFSSLSSNYAFLDPSVSYNTTGSGADVVLTMNVRMNQSSVNASQLSNALYRGYSAGNSMLTNLLTASTDESPRLSGEQAAASLRNARLRMDGMTSDVSNRLAGLRFAQSGNSVNGLQLVQAGNVTGVMGDAPAIAEGLWASADYSHRHDNADSKLGSHASITSADALTIGIDRQASPEMRIGAAVSVDHNRTSYSDLDAKTKADGGLAMVYGSYQPFNRPVYVTGMLGYGQWRNTSERTVTVGGVSGAPHGEYTTRSTVAYVESGINLNGLYGVVWQPYVGVKVGHYRQNAYNETGSADYDLSYASKNQTSTSSVLGLRHLASSRTADNQRLDFLADLQWQHNFGTIDNSLTAAFVSAPDYSYLVFGTPMGRNSVRAAGTLKRQQSKSLTLQAQLAAQAAPGTHGVSASVNAQWRW